MTAIAEITSSNAAATSIARRVTSASDERVVVRPVTAADQPAVLALLGRHDSATIFHDPRWIAAVENAFGARGRPLGAWRGPRLVGVLPLMLVRSALAGRRLISVPYATECGVLAEDEISRMELARGAQQLAHDESACMVEIRSRRADLAGWACHSEHVTFERPLPEDLDGLERYLPRKARAAARQAEQRAGLRVCHAPDQCRLVWELYSRSMRRLGSLNYPRRFFDALQHEFAERVWWTSVWDGRRPIGGALSFVDGATVRPYFAGVDERSRVTGATNLLYLAIMRRAVEAKLRRFDFGRTRRDNAGPYSFKRNQGFEPAPLTYQRYSPASAVVADLSPAAPRFALARRVWPRLPLSITRPLGAWLSSAIPG